MPFPLSLIVAGPKTSKQWIDTVRQSDLQDLHYSDYQVIYADSGGSDQYDRLVDLTTRRPNTAVISGDVQAAIDHVDGEYVLVLAGEDRLQPWGLRTLLERAQASAADLVIGRSAGTGPIGFVPEILRRTRAIGDADPSIAMLAPIVLIRTALLRSVLDSTAVDQSWRALRVELLNAASSLEVVIDPPVAIGSGPGAAESVEAVWSDVDDAAALIDDPTARARFVAAHAAATLRRTPEAEVATQIASVAGRHVDARDLQEPVDLPHADTLHALLAGSVEKSIATAANLVRPLVTCNECRWDGGQLHLSLTVQVVGTNGSALPDWVAAVTPDLLIRHPSSSAVYSVDTSVRRTAGSGADSSFTVEASIDPATAAAGGELVAGQWTVMVRLLGTDSDAPETAGVPFSDPGSAIIDGVPIRAYAENNGFRLDVGATKHGIFGDSVPEDATVSESAAGSLLTVRLPRIAVRGDSRLAGHLLLGKFPLPSVLISESDAARLECYVSGLASVSPLSGRYRPAADQALGLQLRIGAAGDISVEKVKRAAPKTPASKSPASKSPAPKSPAPKPAAAATPEPKSATTDQAVPKPPASDSKHGATAHTYPSSQPSAFQQLATTLKPAGAYLPKPIRRRARKAYRKFVR